MPFSKRKNFVNISEEIFLWSHLKIFDVSQFVTITRPTSPSENSPREMEITREFFISSLKRRADMPYCWALKNFNRRWSGISGKRKVFSFYSLKIFSAVQNIETDGDAWANQRLCNLVLAHVVASDSPFWLDDNIRREIKQETLLLSWNFNIWNSIFVE